MQHHENPELDAIYSRMSAIEQRMESRLDAGSDRMDRIESKLDANSAATEEVRAATEEVRDIVVMGKSFFKVLGHVGSGIKWIASVGAACAGIWLATKEWWAK